MTPMFKHFCTCGGYALTVNGRPKEQPHMTWCPQYKEYCAWYVEMGVQHNSGQRGDVKNQVAKEPLTV